MWGHTHFQSLIALSDSVPLAASEGESNIACHVGRTVLGGTVEGQNAGWLLLSDIKQVHGHGRLAEALWPTGFFPAQHLLLYVLWYVFL